MKRSSASAKAIARGCVRGEAGRGQDDPVRASILGDGARSAWPRSSMPRTKCDIDVGGMPVRRASSVGRAGPRRTGRCRPRTPRASAGCRPSPPPRSAARGRGRRRRARRGGRAGSPGGGSSRQILPDGSICIRPLQSTSRIAISWAPSQRQRRPTSRRRSAQPSSGTIDGEVVGRQLADLRGGRARRRTGRRSRTR